MKVLIVGGGGREHALAAKIKESPLLTRLYAAPGNAGIAQLAECIDIKADDIDGLTDFALKNKIDLTVVGPEVPLVNGIVDRFQSEALLIFGPSKDAAKLEGSKVYSKTLMKAAGVPTADFQVFNNVNDAKRYIADCDPPIVIKADGLAAGKGVVIAKSCEEGIHAVNQMIADKIFGDAGSRVVIEECLQGEELSLLALTDGERIIPLASSQDHKRAFDGDHGPNTGGMGAYSPALNMTEVKLTEILNKTAKPIILKLKEDGIVYRGLLYVGVMLTESGPYVLEYNVRFGDPETQAVLPRLKSDLLTVLLQVAKGRLEIESLEWDERACLTVVIASAGYPGHYDTGHLILGFDRASEIENTHVFHAGSSKNTAGEIRTSGGRVLAVSSLGTTLREAQEKAYEAVKLISFQGAFYRSDIGTRAILEHQTELNRRQMK